MVKLGKKPDLQPTQEFPLWTQLMPSELSLWGDTQTCTQYWVWVSSELNSSWVEQVNSMSTHTFCDIEALKSLLSHASFLSSLALSGIFPDWVYMVSWGVNSNSLVYTQELRTTHECPKMSVQTRVTPILSWVWVLIWDSACELVVSLWYCYLGCKL